MAEEAEEPSSDWAASFQPDQVAAAPEKRTGMPPGNVSRVPGELDQRIADEAKGGRQFAIDQAWARKEARSGKSSSAPFGVHNFKDALGGKTSPPRASTIKPKDIQGLSATVQLAHAMLALKLKDESWALDESEATMLTSAVVDLLNHYGIKLSGTASAWSGLVYAVTMVYGTRIGGLIIDRMKSTDPVQPNTQGPAQVVRPNFS